MSNFKKRMESYRRHLGSFLLFLLVMLSALATFVVLLFLIAYILIKGVPNLKPSLFSWTYTTENASMLPSIVNTLIMTVLSLLIAVPLGIFSAIYLTEYAKKGNKLVMNLGFSHPIELEDPEGITTEAPDATTVIVKGIDKAQVGNYAANIRAYRRPEPYKGKGIKYDGEVIRRKEGKTGASS